MKLTFIMNSDMLSMIGSTFYPTHHIMIMSDNANTLEQLEQAIKSDMPHTTYYVLSPQEIIHEIGATVVDNDEPLPSVGTPYDRHSTLLCHRYAR